MDIDISMSKQLVILMVLMLGRNIYAQHLDWSYSIGGNQDDRCYDMEISTSGNIYLTGGICNSVDFDVKGKSTIVSALGTNMSDIFITRYDSNMDLINAFALPGTEWDYATDLEIDESNNIYISGSYYGTVDFDPSQDEYKLSAPESMFFIAKYDSNGVFEWAKNIYDETDPSLGLIGSKMFSDGNSNIYLNTPETLRKFDQDGRNAWSIPVDGLAEYDGKSNFYILSGPTTPYFPERNDHLLLTKIDSSGSELFTKEIISNSSNGVSGRLSYDKSGNLIISGMFWGTCAFTGIDDMITMTNTRTYCCLPRGACGDCPSFNGYLAKFDTAGNIRWVYDFGDDSPVPDIIETTSDGSIFTLGNFSSLADFDHTEINRQLTNSGYGYYIAKYDDSCNFLAATEFMGGSYNDYIGDFRIIDDSVAYICGHFFNTIDLNLDEGISGLSAGPPEDIFIAKYSDFDIKDFTILKENEIKSATQLLVYPNPTSGLLIIEHNAGSIEKVTIQSINGQTVLAVNNYKDNPIDLSSFSDGIYLVVIHTSVESFVEKIIKF